MRLIEPTAGRIVLDGDDVTALSERDFRAFRRKVQLIFQDPFASLNPRMTVGADPRRAADAARHGAGGRAPGARRRAPRAGRPARPQYAGRYPHEFSGGQRQRIVIARALAVEPKIDHLRRAGVGARRVDPGADPEPPEGAAGAARPRLHLHLARSLGREAHRRPHRRHVSRPHRRDRAGGRRSSPIRATPIRAPCCRRSRSPRRRRAASAASSQGDVPSPIDPPPGCHLHTALPLCGRALPRRAAAALRRPGRATPPPAISGRRLPNGNGYSAGGGPSSIRASSACSPLSRAPARELRLDLLAPRSPSGLPALTQLGDMTGRGT